MRACCHGVGNAVRWACLLLGSDVGCKLVRRQRVAGCHRGRCCEEDHGRCGEEHDVQVCLDAGYDSFALEVGGSLESAAYL